MRLRFLGAAGEVTGSCTLVETDRARVLVDFGLHQGGAFAERRNRRMPPIRPADLDAILLTHAHLDHSGRLPLLAREPFTGPIYATPATIEMCDILLHDSAHVQQMEAERATRRRLRVGRAPVQPLYATSDVDRVLKLLKPIKYDAPMQVADGVTARFVDAGHILGSASIELTIDHGGTRKVVAFSGDIGPTGAPLLRDPMPIEHADAMILESTYGDKDHPSRDESIEELARIIRSARTPEGKVIIPAFAVGRTQQLLYFIGLLLRDGRLSEVNAFIDSPMAITTTELYKRCHALFDADYHDILSTGEHPLDFDGLHIARTVDESRAINSIGNGVVVISAAGMCTGGRILHHFKHNLWKPDVHVVFVGYQADGTLGRRILDGARKVTIMGTPIVVRARVHVLNGFSAHAGQSELVDWASHAAAGRPRIILNHGEDRPRLLLRERLLDRFGIEADLPEWGDITEI
jgi:metallo-beta-lactamase family protein